MSEKVKLSKEQTRAIEVVMGRADRKTIVSNHVKYPNGWDRQDFVTSLNGMPLDTLIRALYIGYEVELTPYEQIRAIYEKHNGGVKGSIAWESQEDIEKIVTLLGHKIIGVNA